MKKVVTLISLSLLALAVGVSFSHLLQWEPKAALPPQDFLTIHQVLLSRYGVGVGLVEGFADITLFILAFLIRGNKQHLDTTLLALLSVVVMIAIWAIFINPINREVNSWTAASVPDHWQSTLNSWHTFHAIRFALAALAFVSLGWGALCEHGGYSVNRGAQFGEVSLKT